jgi:hypothetical protein
MIDRNGDGFELICDHCNRTPMVEFDSFEEVVRYKIAKRWKPIKTKTQGWVDLCPKCAIPEKIAEYRNK